MAEWSPINYNTTSLPANPSVVADVFGWGNGNQTNAVSQAAGAGGTAAGATEGSGFGMDFLKNIGLGDIGSVMGLFNSLAQWKAGNEYMDLMKKQMKQNQAQYEENLKNQKQTLNTQYRDRAESRGSALENYDSGKYLDKALL